MGYRIVAQVSDVETYARRRALVGLSRRSREGMAKGLHNSQHAVLAVNELGPVGMGRIIGDGGTAYQITDIAVDPDHQGKGWERRSWRRLSRGSIGMARVMEKTR